MGLPPLIRRSGLSAGAVYGYFATKDELILAALTSSMASLGIALAPLFNPSKTLPPVEFIREFTSTIDHFTKQDGIDRMRIAMHGWSEQQRNPSVRAVMQSIYQDLRRQLEGVVGRWQEEGLITTEADGSDIASFFFSMVLGFVAQSAILGDAEPDQHARALAALIDART